LNTSLSSFLSFVEEEAMSVLKEHIRFPLMTCKQIASAVVPTVVLSPEELVEVYTYIAMDGTVDCRYCSRPRSVTRRPEHVLYRSGRAHPHAVGSWGFSGAIDAVTVVIDRPVWIHGLSVFGGTNHGLCGRIFIRRGASAQVC
jgi:hypothetical protein